MRAPLALAFLALFGALALPPMAVAQEAGQGQSEGYTLRPRDENHPNPVALAPGDALVYEWAVLEPAGARLSFSTHIHIGAQQVNLTEEEVSAASGRLVADREGLYSVLWRNLEEERVTYRYTYHVERAGGGDNATPLPALAALAALPLAAVVAALLRRRG